MVEATGVEVPVPIREAGDLTRYAAQSRYWDVDDETLEPAVRVAWWAEMVIGRLGGPVDGAADELQ